MSGSGISLCHLLSGLDRDAYRPSLVLSREAQKEYFRKHLRVATDTTVIQCADSLKNNAVLQKIASAGKGVHRVLFRIITAVISMMDVWFVIAPYTFKLYRHARSKKIDAIHHNNGFDLAAIWLGMILRVPIIAYQRGEEWDSWLVRRFSKFARFYIANSEKTKRDLIKIGIDEKKTCVVYPPVDLEKYDYAVDCTSQRDEFKIIPTDYHIGILGILLDWKGQDIFLKAVQRIVARLPRCRAFVIGQAPDADKSYEEYLIELCKQLNVMEHVVFTGFRHDVPQMIQLLDVVVHCSTSPEPFGRVLVEAMAMKKPVVASKAGGPVEIIEDGRNGYLVDPGDYEGVAQRVLDLLLDPEKAAGMGERGYSDVKSRYSVDGHIKRMHGLYKSILQEETSY